jgi:hypothetical protein
MVPDPDSGGLRQAHRPPKWGPEPADLPDQGYLLRRVALAGQTGARKGETQGDAHDNRLRSG